MPDLLQSLRVMHMRPDQLKDFVRLFNTAIRSAPAGSRLMVVLEVMAMNIFHQFRPDFDPTNIPADDHLVDYPWIDAASLHSTRNFLGEIVKEKARTPWSRRMHIGRTPVDETIAAELQASWAGALWMLGDLRRAVGATILLGGRDNHYEEVYGALMWTLGGGSDLPAVLGLVERHLDAAGADFFFKQVSKPVLHPDTRRERLTKVAPVIWDTVGRETAGLVLEALPAEPYDAPLARDVNRIWALMALRIPAGWRRRFSGLNQSQQWGVIDSMSPAIIEELSSDLAGKLLRTLNIRQDWSSETYAVGVALARRSNTSIADIQDRMADASLGAATEVLLVAPQAIPIEKRRELVTYWSQAVDRAFDEALGGQQNFGGRSAAGMLGAALRSLPKPLTDGVDVLTRVAADVRAPAQQRLEALQALAGLVHDRSVTLRRVGTARTAPTESGVSVFPGVGPEHIRAAQLQLAAGSFTRKEAVDCSVLMRHSDPEVRELAVNGCALSLRATEDPALEGAYLGALFDPVDAVAQLALSAAPDVRLTLQSSKAILLQRADDLIDAGTKSLRATAARFLKEEKPAGGQARNALRRARRDPSWVVRRAARSN